MTVTGDDGWALKGRSVVFDCRAEGWYPEPGLQWQLNDREVGNTGAVGRKLGTSDINWCRYSGAVVTLSSLR